MTSDRRFSKVDLLVLPRRELLKLGLGAAGLATLPKCTILTGPGLPPGDDGIVGAQEIPPISSNPDFYVVNFAEAVHVDRELWNLFVYDEAEYIGGIDASQLDALELEEREHTLQCVESRPDEIYMDNAIWGGRPLLDVLDAAGIAVPETAQWILCTGADLFTTRISTDDLEGSWLVWEMNGQPLPLNHGHPARLIVPGRFGWLNCKQLVSLAFRESRPVLPWEESTDNGNGQEVNGEDLNIQSMAVFPTDLSLIDSESRVRFLGKAYAGSDPIVWVGLSADGGETWEDAEVTYSPGPDRWTLWRFLWTPPGPGTHDFVIGARSASGRETTVDPPPEEIPYFGGMVLRVTVV